MAQNPSSLDRFPLAMQGETDKSYLVLESHDFMLQGGDVVIQLGESCKNILVLHSEVLSKYSPWLRAMFKDNWHEPKLVQVNGEERKVWWLELYFDQEVGLGLLKHKVCIMILSIQHG